MFHLRFSYSLARATVAWLVQGLLWGGDWSNRYPYSVSPKSVRLIYILSDNFVSWKSLHEVPNRMPNDLQGGYTETEQCVFI